MYLRYYEIEPEKTTHGISYPYFSEDNKDIIYYSITDGSQKVDVLYLHRELGPAIFSLDNSIEETYFLYNYDIGNGIEGKLSLAEWYFDATQEFPFLFSEEEEKVVLGLLSKGNEKVRKMLLGPIKTEIESIFLSMSGSDSPREAYSKLVKVPKNLRFLKHASLGVLSLFASAYLSACGTEIQKVKDNINPPKKEESHPSKTNQKEILPVKFYVHSDFIEIVDEFFAYHAKETKQPKEKLIEGLNFSINWYDEKEALKEEAKQEKGLSPFEAYRSSLLGVCIVKGEYSNKREVLIRKSLTTDDFVRLKWVIWHELGHCLLNRNHVNQQEISFMTPGPDQSWWIEEKFEEMIKELFDPESMKKPTINLIENEINDHEIILKDGTKIYY